MPEWSEKATHQLDISKLKPQIQLPSGKPEATVHQPEANSSPTWS